MTAHPDIFIKGCLQNDTPRQERLYKLCTVYEIVGHKYKGYKEIKLFSLSQSVLEKIGEKDSIAINKLGWFNCYRF